jgi:hypothetical protein
VPASTLRFGQILPDSVRATVAAAIASRGGSVTWRDDAGSDRTYGLVELPQGAPAVRAVVREPVTVFEAPIIALAVSPSVPEALPQLLEAFAGPGRPDGILSCEASNGRLILEWNPDRTKTALVFSLLDTELRRFASGRTGELLAPLPEALAAQIAAEGLGTPEIASNRVLETLLERMGMA